MLHSSKIYHHFSIFFLERKSNSAIFSLTTRRKPCKYETAIFLVGKMIHFDFQCARILPAKKFRQFKTSLAAINFWVAKRERKISKLCHTWRTTFPIISYIGIERNIALVEGLGQHFKSYSSTLFVISMSCPGLKLSVRAF